MVTVKVKLVNVIVSTSGLVVVVEEITDCTMVLVEKSNSVVVTERVI